MANLKKKFNEILEDFEKNIKNKEDLDYIKSQVYNIALLFLDEVDKLTELSFDRLNVMIDRERELSKRIANMEKVINNLEREIFIPQECDFEIVCPYCNAEFVEDLARGIENEVRCPECGNMIEIDWHETEGCCEHECSGECNCEECDECNEENDNNQDFDDEDIEEENTDDEDDM